MKKLKQWQQDAILDIMSNFNFTRIADLMACLDWRWAVDGDSAKLVVPNIDTIKEEALDLLKRSCEKKSSIATGGFYVTIDSKEKFLELSFIVEHWDYIADEYETH